MNLSETLTAAVLAVMAFIVIIAVSTFWIFLSVLIWSVLGTLMGWAFSGHFAIWENKTGLTMGEIGAMLGFLSAAFRVKITMDSKS